MDKAKANQEIERIHQEYTDDIREFWSFAKSLAVGRSNVKKLADDTEQMLPGAAGSTQNNPDKLSRFPHSISLIITILLIYEFVLLEKMINRYKRFQRKSNINLDKESWKIEKLISTLGAKSVDLQRGRIIRDLLVHNDGVMSKRTFAKCPEICKSICPVGERVSLEEFDLIYEVAEALYKLNEHLRSISNMKLVEHNANLGTLIF